MAFFDAHLHLIQAVDLNENVSVLGDFYGATCSHWIEEYCQQESYVRKVNEFFGEKKYIHLFGIHPQKPLLENLEYLEELLEKKRVDGIGEVGYDLFTPEFRSTFEVQEKVFVECLHLAVKYSVPVVIHDRKAFDQLLHHVDLLRKVPSCVFHGFPFTPNEANILLSKKVNGYFSFGKALLKGNKKSYMCVRELPFDRLLAETDAPYMTLKDECSTPVGDIEKVYRAFLAIRKTEALECLSTQLKSNYSNAFLLG